MFVQGRALSHVGPEWPLDVLNHADAFLPLALPSGETLLLAKDAIIEVETTAEIEDDPYRAAGARPEAIEVRLSGGVVRSGTVRMEVPSDHSRVLDFLNRQDGRFLRLFTAGGLRLVNRRLIESVRHLD